MSKKTMKELLANFHHVGVVVRNIDDAMRYYEGLGFDPFKSMGRCPMAGKCMASPPIW